MASASSQFSPAELAQARETPIFFVVRRATMFAAGYALISLIFEVALPSWLPENNPAHTLFVSLVGGLIGAVLVLLLARRAARRDETAARRPIS